MMQHPTEAVVKRHLRTFLDGKGADAIVDDYHQDACLITQAGIFKGKEAIRQYFVVFLQNLPPNAVPRFSLDTLLVDGDIAMIAWHVGADVPFATDTFVIREQLIASQTFAMHQAR